MTTHLKHYFKHYQSLQTQKPSINLEGFFITKLEMNLKKTLIALEASIEDNICNREYKPRIR